MITTATAIVISVLCLARVYGVKLERQPDVVYDMTEVFDEDGSIKDEHVLECGEYRDWTQVDGNNASEPEFEAKLSASNFWFRWTTKPRIESIEISMIGGTEYNDWLYFVFDADGDAAEGFLTISALKEVCYQCANTTNVIDVDFDSGAFERGTYWIGANGLFNISLECQKRSVSLKELDPDELGMMIAIILVLFLFAMFSVCFAAWRNYQYAIRKMGSPEKAQTEAAIEFAGLNPDTAAANDDGDGGAVVAADEEKDNADGHGGKDQDDDDDDEEDADEEYARIKKELLKAQIPGIDDYEHILDAVEDAIDDETIDTYQAFAFRQSVKDEHRPIPEGFSQLPLWSPTKLQWMFTFSKYQQALYKAAIVCFLQTFGITVTLLSVMTAYFDGEQSSRCEWEADVWQEEGTYKVLAFLWAWVITISVLIIRAQIHATGLNRLLKPKSLRKADDRVKRMKRISRFASIGILEWGMINNDYTLTWAIIGSFFLIYQSEGGEDALDMILNAVALYFMMELDDMLVSKRDFKDLREHRNEQAKALLEYVRMKKENPNLDPDSDLDESLDISWFTWSIFYFAAVIRFLSALIIIASTSVVPFIILACW